MRVGRKKKIEKEARTQAEKWKMHANRHNMVSLLVGRHPQYCLLQGNAGQIYDTQIKLN